VLDPEVLMPKAGAPIARVAAWLSPQTIVMPGWLRPLLWPDDANHALADTPRS
jgi:hypothetical protein